MLGACLPLHAICLILCSSVAGSLVSPAACSLVRQPICMDPYQPPVTQSEGTQSRFGESRFGSSRFGPSRAGTWIEEGPEDSNGRAAGLYRSGGSDAAVTGLTVVRPASATSASRGAVQAENQSGTRALSLPGGRSGVLLFHGLSSTPLELQYLARGLQRAGHTVRVAVIEGYSHGLPSSKPTEYRQWAQAAVAEFDRMKSQCDTVAVGGLCIGALLSLHVAARRNGFVSHVLALSTTLLYDGWAAPWTRRLLPMARVFPVLGRIAVKEREPYGLKDERLRAWIAGQMKESGGSDAGASVLRVRDLLEAQNLMQLVRQGLKQITAPTLLIHARDDDCASPKSAFEVSNGVSSQRVHCVLLENSYHMISIDKEKARVLAEMKEFLQPPGSNVDAKWAPPVGASAPETVRSSEHVRA